MGNDNRKQWLIGSFDWKLKNKFMGRCKMLDRDWKKILENLMRGWLYDNDNERTK